MKGYVKKHLRELIWFSFLNQTDIFLSHELFEFLYICYRKKKYRLNEHGLKLMLRKTVFDAIYKDNEGELKWISENNKDYKVLIKNDLIFLRDRSKNIMRKWFLVSYKQFLKITCDFEYEEEDIYFFDMIMEIDEEYKKMLMYCHNKGLSLEDEVYSILNVKNDNYIEDIENEDYINDELDLKEDQNNGYYDYDSELKSDEDLIFGHIEDIGNNRSSFISLKNDHTNLSNSIVINKHITDSLLPTNDTHHFKYKNNSFSSDSISNNNILSTLINKNVILKQENNVLKNKPNSKSSHINYASNTLINDKSEPIYNTISSHNANLHIKSNGYYIDSKFIPLDDDDNISDKATEILNKHVDISLTPNISLSPEDSSLTSDDISKDNPSLSKEDLSLITTKIGSHGK